MKVNSPIVLLVAAACQAHNLDDVPIIGASAEEEAAIRAELDSIRRVYDSSTLSLSKIRIDDQDDKKWGHYNYVTRAISVTRNDLGRMRLVVRHEVCHALDYQLGLQSFHGDVFREAFWSLLEPTHLEPYANKSAKVQAREAFATLCAMGAGPLHAIATNAAVTDDRLREAALQTEDLVAMAEPDPVEEEPWVAPGEWPAPWLLALYGNDHVGLIYQGDDNIHLNREGERVDFADINELPVDYQNNIQPFYHGPGVIDGEVVQYGEAASGARALAIILPTAGSPHLFVANATEPWAAVGHASNPFIYSVDGTLTLGWTDQDTEFQVVQIR